MPRRARRWIGRWVSSRAVEVDRARVDRHQADDHVEAGGLAGAVRAEQADHLAARHLQRHVLHDGARLVALAQASATRSCAHRAACAGVASLAAGGRRLRLDHRPCTAPSVALPARALAARSPRRSRSAGRRRCSRRATSSPPRLTRAFSNSSIFSFRSSISMRSASPSIQMPSFSPAFGVWLLAEARRLAGGGGELEALGVLAHHDAVGAQQDRALGEHHVAFEDVHAARVVGAHLFASICVGLSWSAFSAQRRRPPAARAASESAGSAHLLRQLRSGFEARRAPRSRRNSSRDLVVVLHAAALTASGCPRRS